MQLDRPLAVITPTADGDVLMVLARADAAFTTRQVHTLADPYSYSGVRKVLERLVTQGIVRRRRYGTTDAFQLNRDHLAAGPIVELASLRATFVGRLRAEIEQWPLPPVYAALFGSAARGGMHPGSDIDLFVVRAANVGEEDPQWLDQLGQLESRAASWTGNDARVLEYSDESVRALWSDEPVLDSVRTDAVTLFGTSSYWRSIRRGNEER